MSREIYAHLYALIAQFKGTSIEKGHKSIVYNKERDRQRKKIHQ